MARTKNRGTNTAVSQFSKQALKWRLGKYLRLSKDDFKRGNAKDKEVSDSIENQRKVLNEFEQMNADCSRAMSRIASKELYVYYQCGTYKSLSKKACTMHSIKSTRLEAATLYAVRQQVHLAVSYSAIVSQINIASLKKSQSVRLEQLIFAKEKELAKIMRYKQSLYQDWKDGDITHNDYRHMSED